MATATVQMGSVGIDPLLFEHGLNQVAVEQDINVPGDARKGPDNHLAMVCRGAVAVRHAAEVQHATDQLHEFRNPRVHVFGMGDGHAFTSRLRWVRVANFTSSSSSPLLAVFHALQR